MYAERMSIFAEEISNPKEYTELNYDIEDEEVIKKGTRQLEIARGELELLRKNSTSDDVSHPFGYDYPEIDVKTRDEFLRECHDIQSEINSIEEAYGHEKSEIKSLKDFGGSNRELTRISDDVIKAIENVNKITSGRQSQMWNWRDDWDFD